MKWVIYDAALGNLLLCIYYYQYILLYYIFTISNLPPHAVLTFWPYLLSAPTLTILDKTSAFSWYKSTSQTQ